MNEQVLIMNHNGGVVFQGMAVLRNFDFDNESGCLLADCQLPDMVNILVWKIDNVWQGWL